MDKVSTTQRPPYQIILSLSRLGLAHSGLRISKLRACLGLGAGSAQHAHAQEFQKWRIF